MTERGTLLSDKAMTFMTRKPNAETSIPHTAAVAASDNRTRLIERPARIPTQATKSEVPIFESTPNIGTDDTSKPQAENAAPKKTAHIRTPASPSEIPRTLTLPTKYPAATITHTPANDVKKSYITSMNHLISRT